MAGKPGRSGRKPKPTAALKLAGGFRADRRLGDEPEPEVCIPDPPKFLRGEALAEWDRITTLLVELQCISRLDRATLAAYCVEWRIYVTAHNRLRLNNSLLAESTKGTKMAHPLLRVADRAFNNMMRICVEFGLTPASRSRLSMAASGEVEDPLDALIRAQAEQRRARRGAG
jgi:P27 family predicted phage terminase small subunit